MFYFLCFQALLITYLTVDSTYFQPSSLKMIDVKQPPQQQYQKMINNPIVQPPLPPLPQQHHHQQQQQQHFVQHTPQSNKISHLIANNNHNSPLLSHHINCKFKLQ